MAGETYFQRHNRLLTKLLQGKGGEPIEAMAPELQPCIILENDRPEHKFLAEHTPFMGGGFLAQLAANFSDISLNVPNGSGIVVVVEYVLINLSTGGDALMQIIPAQGGGVQVGPRDSRLGIARRLIPTVLQQQQVAAQLGSPPVSFRQFSGQVVKLDVVLQPNTALLVETSAVNLALDVGFVGYYRTLEGSET